MLLAALLALAPPAFEVRGTIPLPGVEGWGRPVFDKPSHRLYVPRETRLHVVDVRTGGFVADVQDAGGVRGVAIVPKEGVGFATLSAGDRVLVFDLKLAAEIKRIPVGDGPDAILYDPRTRRVLVANRTGRSVGIVDPKALVAEAAVALDGHPVALVADGRGGVFAATENGIVRVEIARRRVVATLPVKDATDLAFDARRNLLYAATPGRLTVLDAKTGGVRETAAVAESATGVLADDELGLAFAYGADALAVVHAKDATPVVQNLPLPTGVRRGAIDADDHRLYLLGPAPDRPNAARVIVVARTPGRSATERVAGGNRRRSTSAPRPESGP